jgi:hypothetical protein
MASKYYWPLLGQERMVTKVSDDIPNDMVPSLLLQELRTPLHLAPGIKIHSATSLVGEKNNTTVLGYNMDDEVVETSVVSYVEVSFENKVDLLIKRETTFRLYFCKDYPETPPIVHIIIDGQCNDLLVDQYDDPRVDTSSRGSLYNLRMCQPADGWMPTYTIECVIFGLRWTLTKTLSASTVAKVKPVSKLGTLFERDLKSKDGPIVPRSNGVHLMCSCLNHEEQGYRDSMEDVVLALDESSLPGVGSGSKLPYRFYAVFDGHGGDYSAHYAGKHLPQHLQTNIVEKNLSIRESIFDACRTTDQELLKEIDKQFVQDTSGSTMCAVVIDEAGLLTCANIGDSRAVLCRAGRAVSFSFLFFYFISRFRKMFF